MTPAFRLVAFAIQAGLWILVCAGGGCVRSGPKDEGRSARRAFAEASALARRVDEGSSRASRRDWNRAIDRLTEVARRFPGTVEGRRAILEAAGLAGRLAVRTGFPDDRIEALSLYRAAVRYTSGSEAAHRALERFSGSAGPEERKPLDGNGRPPPSAEEDERLIQGLPVLAGFAADPDKMGIRFTSPKAEGVARLIAAKCFNAANLARVVLHLSRPVRYSHGVLQARAGEAKARLYLDVETSRLAGSAGKGSRCVGPLVRRMRAALHGKNRVRVVLEVNVPARFKIYPLLHPYRVVVDLRRPEVRPAAGIPVRVVAIDPGHGGDNLGAVGPSGLEEKRVTLSIARHLKRYLGTHRIRAVLTRRSDRTVPLEERTASALAGGADLLVSIHVNAEPSGERQSVETYSLETGSDEFARKLAERENAAPPNSKEPDRLLLSQLVEEAITQESVRLAQQVHRALLPAVRAIHPKTSDGGVRKAVFYVLLTARMPAVLVEVSHISHKEGEAFLRKEENLRKIAEAIGRGVVAYSDGRKRATVHGVTGVRRGSTARRGRQASPGP